MTVLPPVFDFSLLLPLLLLLLLLTLLLLMLMPCVRFFPLVLWPVVMLLTRMGGAICCCCVLLPQLELWLNVADTSVVIASGAAVVIALLPFDVAVADDAFVIVTVCNVPDVVDA